MTTREKSVPVRQPGEAGERQVETWQPNVDVYETENELTLLVDLPGVRPEEIDVHFENGVLSLTGRLQERREEQGTWLLREYGVGDFHRSFRVGDSVVADGIQAEHAGGVLTLHLPKSDAVKPRRIEVEPA
jgi:HSP20 family protein